MSLGGQDPLLCYFPHGGYLIYLRYVPEAKHLSPPLPPNSKSSQKTPNTKRPTAKANILFQLTTHVRIADHL